MRDDQTLDSRQDVPGLPTAQSVAKHPHSSIHERVANGQHDALALGYRGDRFGVVQTACTSPWRCSPLHVLR